MRQASENKISCRPKASALCVLNNRYAILFPAATYPVFAKQTTIFLLGFIQLMLAERIISRKFCQKSRFFNAYCLAKWAS
jgi:hypothetical protein